VGPGEVGRERRGVGEGCQQRAGKVLAVASKVGLGDGGLGTSKEGSNL